MKDIIKMLIEDNDLTTLNIVFVALISAHNNRSPKEIEINCRKLTEMAEVLAEYPDNPKLVDMRDKIIKYNEVYAPKEE